MATNTFSAAPDNTSDATFRAWGSALSAALAAVGMVKTADTGQINWATVVKPAAVNTQSGYEVWRFNDALQATAPLYVRIGYGSGSNTLHPSLWFTCGKGSDGAGTITSPLHIIAQMVLGFINTSATPWYVCSGDGSLLAIAPAPGLASSANSCVALIERSRSAAGAATGSAMAIAFKTQASVNVYMRNYALTTGYSLTSWPAAIPVPNSTSPIGIVGSASKAPLFPAVLTDGQANVWQPRGMLTYSLPDIGALAAVSVAGWNTYLPLGTAGQYWDSGVAVGYGAMAWW